MRLGGAWLAPFMWLFVAVLSPAAGQEIERFFGRYVGDGVLHELLSGDIERRDVVTTIAPYGDGGFAVRWNSVVRVDGRRDVPGVRHIVRSIAFEPTDDGAYFVQAPDYDPFRLRDRLEPMAGDALAWARIEGDVLDVFVFALTTDGVGELQRHRRALTATGLRLAYTGILDGVVVTTGSGTMVRVGDAIDITP